MMREMVCKIPGEIQKLLSGRIITCLPVIRMLANEGRLSMNEILKLDNVEKYYGNKANLTKAVSLSELWEPAAPARQRS